MARARKGKSKKKKDKNPRMVKEGSPFEEELLVDYLNGASLSKEEKIEISNLIKALTFFSYIDESVLLHETAEKFMEISKKFQRTLEQQKIMALVPHLRDNFLEIQTVKYTQEDQTEWEDLKFMKH